MTSRTVGPPITPLVVLTIATIATVVAIPIALHRSTSPADLEILNPVGWLLGVGAVLAFIWFRKQDDAASADRHYVIPRWNPRAVASVLALAGWLASVCHAYVIADFWARR